MRYKILAILSVAMLSIALLSQYTDPTSAGGSKAVIAGSQLSASTAPTLKFPLLPVQWLTVVNNGFDIPGSTLKFSSYGQPSVNTNGVVAFRARSTGSSDRQSGIYRRMSLGSPIEAVATIDFLVPFPNNLEADFTEFPSIPRISPNAANIATIGNHRPVYRYVLPTGEETRVGTTGIYMQLESDLLITGASKLGAVPGFEHFRVPGVEPAMPFSVFPGSPAINDAGTIAFKANYSIGDVERTGIFYRDVLNTPGGGNGEVQMVANTEMTIPNLPYISDRIRFGSTAPPSVMGNDIVFVGLDNEENPRWGGIYLSTIDPMRPETGRQLRAIAHVGSNAQRATSFSRIGEGISFDGRFAAYWAGKGADMKTIRLNCPTDGNPDIIAYCNGVDPNSIFDPDTGGWYQLKQVPVDQGIYVYDRFTERTARIAGSVTDFNDFVFWVYSGKAPGTGSDEEEAEPPRWRGSAFVAIYDGLVAFKARTATLDPSGSYTDIVDGIYIKGVPAGSPIETVMELGLDASLIDPTLNPGEMTITGLGIEREGLRGSYLAITVTMANAEESWGGIYMANVTAPRSPVMREMRDKRK
ncbi:MAG: hypothetical protein KF881_11260 [Acidobacteria bacterium]|nr:hypothetical protein [Acidobacteriota bacterium]